MIETFSDLLGRLRQSSAIFEKCSEMFGNVRKMSRTVRPALGIILENLRKIAKNAVISMFI